MAAIGVDVRGADNHRTLTEIDVNSAFELDGSGKVTSNTEFKSTSSLLSQKVNGFLDRCRVVSRSIAPDSEER